jgi:hypothetical protein
LRPTDEDYDIIQAFVVAGKFDKADKKIDALRNKEKPKEEPKESEEERIERLAKAKSAELLKPEGGEPSATSQKRMDIIGRYAAGDPTVSRKDYEEAMKSR